MAMQSIPAAPRALPPPLTTAADMPARWLNLDDAFDAAAQKIVDAHLNDGDPRDLPVMDLRSWGVIPADGRFALAPLAKHHAPMILRTAAFSNLTSRLGAPPDFIRKLPAPLQLANMNWLLTSQADSMPAMLRLRGDEVSAVVSDRYAPLDAPELLDAVREALVKHGALEEVRVKSIATGLVDVVRLVFPSATAAVKVGDVSALGVDISTSSFARSSLHVRGLVWRLKCTNGLRVAESRGSFSFRHIGDSQRLRDGIAEAIPSALMEARGTMAKWKNAVTVMVEDVAGMIERLRDLTIPEKKAVESELKKDLGVPELPAHVPLYDLVNAVTATAHHAVPARRIEIEGVGGELLAAHTRGVG
jgi:hypothetical protein